MTKAPKFDDIPGFNKAANSLFEIRTYTRSDGAIFVNLDERESIVTQPDMQELRVLERDMSVVDEWTVEGEFNWKLAGGCGIETATAMTDTMSRSADSVFAPFATAWSGRAQRQDLAYLCWYRRHISLDSAYPLSCLSHRQPIGRDQDHSNIGSEL